MGGAICSSPMLGERTGIDTDAPRTGNCANYRSPSVVVAIHRFQGSEGTVWICHRASAELDAQPSPPLRQKRATNARREQAAIVLAGRFTSIGRRQAHALKTHTSDVVLFF